MIPAVRGLRLPAVRADELLGHGAVDGRAELQRVGPGRGVPDVVLVVLQLLARVGLVLLDVLDLVP